MTDTTKPVILVCGFGRCGTSMIMQMLDAGGIPTLGEHPAFEDDRAGLERDPSWIAAQNGTAMKLLDPQYPEAPIIPGDYLIIWLDRDHRQQSLSQAKFAHMLMGILMDRKDRRTLEASYRKDLPVALKILNKLGPVLRLRFEDVLSDPLHAATRINIHLDDGDIGRMASQVRPRLAECADGMDMEMALITERDTAAPPNTGGE